MRDCYFSILIFGRYYQLTKDWKFKILVKKEGQWVDWRRNE